MNALFIYFSRLSLKGLAVIPLAVLIRFVIKKQPKIYSYLLWLAVFASLVVDVKLPRFNISTPVSAAQTEILSGYNDFLDDYTGDVDIHHDNTLEYYRAVQQGVKPVYDRESGAQYVVTQKDTTNPAQTMLNNMGIFAGLWSAGMLVLCFFVIKSSLGIYAKIRHAIHYSWNIYLVEKIPSPFVFGIIKPKIYIPESLAVKDLSYIISHEQTHIRRRDYIIKPVCLFITIIHWYNPLVWLAYRMMCRDMEMSCDESVVARMGKDSKKPYTMLLLDFATDTSLTAAVLFGESKAESRIKNVLDFKKPATVVALALAAVVIMFAALPLISRPQPAPSATPAPLTFYEQLDRVNDIDHLQYKYRTGAECYYMYPYLEKPLYNGRDDSIILQPLIPYDRQDKTIPDVPISDTGLIYDSRYCSGVRIDDTGSRQYSMCVFENGVHNIYDYTDKWEVVHTLDNPEGINPEAAKYISHDKISDNYYITTFTGEKTGETGRYIFTVHTENGISKTYSCKLPGTENKTYSMLHRSIRFLNESVGFASCTVTPEQLYGNVPHGLITIDGGKTWQELDFSRLGPKDLTLDYCRGCIVNIYGDVVEIRYHGRNVRLTGLEDNYALISLDGGLTWTGYHRTSSMSTVEKPGFRYIQMTDTIPVMLMTQTEEYRQIHQPEGNVINSVYDSLVKDIIDRYKNNAVEIEGNFKAMPEGFIFPDRLPQLYYRQDEAGFWNTSIFSADGRYRIAITINNSDYTGIDGAVSDPRPQVISVGFYNVENSD